MTPDYILHEISHQNLLLYAAATPSYDTDKEKKEDPKEDLDWGGSLDWSNPENFNDSTNDRIKI